MAYTLQEYYDTGDGTYTEVYSIRWRSQTFTDAIGFDLTRVAIKAYRIGAPGDVTMNIMATTSNKPSGDILGTVDVSANAWTDNSAGDWYNFDFVTPVTIPAATPYCFVLSIPGGNVGNQVRWKIDTTGSYLGGYWVSSTNSGSTWTVNAGSDGMFRTYGGDATSYVDMAFTDTVIFSEVFNLGLIIPIGFTDTITFSEVLNLGGIIPIGFTNTVTFSESMTISFGPLSGTKAEKDTRRLVAFGNDTVYFEEI